MAGVASREEPVVPGRWRVVALATALFVVSQFHRVAAAVVAADLQRDLGLSSEALGGRRLLLRLRRGPGAAGASFDRVGARRSMALLALVGALGAAVLALAERQPSRGCARPAHDSGGHQPAGSHLHQPK